ncbi:MAG: FkbM family methyltransferase [Gammaproteobacteria bacterium]|nr:FkbM family methyltransferase [Gammaproteobacteria bacterium]
MKVLIISAYPPEPAPEANHALHLSEQLAKAGLAVHVLCKKGSIAATQQYIVVHPVIDDWTWSDLARLAKCMRETQPDVVLLLYLGWVFNHNPMITFLPTICRTALPSVPCVTQFENIDVGSLPKSFLTRALRKPMALWAGGKDVHPFFGTLLRDSARIIVLSSPHGARLAKHYSGVEEKSVILPPPPLIRFCSDDPAMTRKQARDAIGATERDFVLVHWGYIYPGKGVDTLLHAFRMVCNQNANVRLVFVGGKLEFPTKTGSVSCSDYYHMVQQLPAKLGIAERVTWTGHFDWDSDEGSRYLHAGDACVLPIDYGVTLNNSSLAAAAAHGVPVIGTELLMGQDEALEHGRNIYLCRPRDSEMLAEMILLISENAALRERLRAGILSLAREWHRWDTMTQHLVGVLEAAVSKSSNVRPSERDDELRQVRWTDSHAAPWVQADEDNGNTPLVSVVVAAYNVEKYLSQCLDSLISQTLRNVEIIVVNDASTDNSLGIINDYISRYPNIRVFSCESNKGLASVRNIGMKVARGEYIAFTDGDDWADVRMCELLHRRAKTDNADVLIADAKVYYEDSKAIGPLFDHQVRRILDSQLRTMPFELSREPRILLLELVAWTKLYKRSFLREHELLFEEGMNSYEDICFHFSVLFKARKISLTDDALLFYRRNRPGQITARTNRKNFETFAIFDRIHENLTSWNASAQIWAMLIRTQLRIFDWLLQDRVQGHHKREFLALVAKQFQKIPKPGFRIFRRQANPEELLKLLCMRRDWLHAYEKVASQHWRLLSVIYQILQRRRVGLKRGRKRGVGVLAQRLTSELQRFVSRLLNLQRFTKKFEAISKSLGKVTGINAFASRGDEPLIDVRRIDDQVLFFSHLAKKSGLADAVWRMENDYYLLHTACFRAGDTIIDVGAHVGVISIYLAKKYPFITVYAIEPDPMNYSCLQRNVELNGVTNVIAINKAVSGKGQEGTLYVDPWDSGWATIDAEVASSRRFLQTVPVESVTLEQLFQEYDISYCRLLKINAPGAVRGSLKAFTRSGCVDLLCGEVNLEDCSRAKLEMASWTIARQHFWRTVTRQPDGPVYSWIQQLPTEIERLPSAEPYNKERKFSDIHPPKRDEVLLAIDEDDPQILSRVWSGRDSLYDITAPLVSVIVAAYNVEKYLSQCLDSLVNQTLKNIEIIVVNDASTDNSVDILDDYKSTYPNVRVVNCEYNRGLASVRNIGMKVARGEYIAFTDGDDWADVRMCEAMYRRASENESDVLIADAKVFYEDSKTFVQFFDHHIRQSLDPRLRTMPFELCGAPRVLLLEPVAWTKIYKRSFLKEHAIQFEDGMNSYEDICFHFSVLLRATTISLTDESFLFYRQNRPGQISGRTSRKVFEVFAVFRKIHDNLASWHVSADIWALLVRVQLRQFDWLLKDRVQAEHKREFLALVAKQLRLIPESGFQIFARQATPDESFKLLCMRRNWLRAYEKVLRGRWSLLPTSYAMLHSRRRTPSKRLRQPGSGMLRRRLVSRSRYFVDQSLSLAKFNKQLRAVNDNLKTLIDANAFASQSEEALVEVCWIDDQKFLFAHWANNPGVRDAVWRMANDYYLSQAAAFREGDTVIDVGAHVGVVSIFLAKKYPFITVYAIEPNPLNYACLRRNIELNDATNVIAINKSISGEGQEGTLYVDPWNCAWATIDPGVAASRRHLQMVPVESVTLEWLFQVCRIRHCRLLKVTAVGAVRRSLKAFTRSNCVDLLCGESDTEDCSRATLELASRTIARQYFWRTVERQANATVYSWIQQLPRLSSDESHLTSLAEADGAPPKNCPYINRMTPRFK